MFPRDNIRNVFTVMHNQVFEYSDTLSFATCILAYTIFYIDGITLFGYIDGKQFQVLYTIYFCLYAITGYELGRMRWFMRIHGMAVKVI